MRVPVAMREPFARFSIRWSKPRDLRLTTTFQSPRTIKPYDSYLERHPDKISQEPLVRVRLYGDDKEFIDGLHKYARTMYSKADDILKDFWDHTLPGDCENQCLYAWMKIREKLGDAVANAIRLALVVTERGDYHAVLVFHLIDEKGEEYEAIMDFRLVEPLIHVGHKAFDRYKFRYCTKPGTNRWMLCVRSERTKRKRVA